MKKASHSPIQLLGISGSIRRESYNSTVLQTIAKLLSEELELQIFPLNDIPLYNADLDGDSPPDAVRALKSSIEHSDGLIICSPEYNYGMPGVLKNALDWASRPNFQSPLKGKPALIMTASPGTAGGVRAQYQIREVLSAALARPIARQHVAIAQVNQKIVDGKLTDETTINFVLKAIEDLIGEVRLVGQRLPT